MERFFNTTGPCDPKRHYMLPPEARIPTVDRLIARQQYFVVHAARQTGKTTAMRALAERKRGEGIAAVYVTLEICQGVEEVEQAENLWIDLLRVQGERQLPAGQRPPPAPTGEPGGRLAAWLGDWCAVIAPTPLVLFLDEADVVRGAPLVNLLRQLRSGFADRPGLFPASIALIGMRDLRDYVTAAKDGAAVSPASPFNIKAESITLRNFTADEVAALYAQHTADTGQVFAPEATARAFELSRGQPFLVNKLAGICVDDLVPDRARAVSLSDVNAAKDRLVLSRTTHLYSLSDRLREPRVARIVSRVLQGDDDVDQGSDDFEYTVDLGLLVRAKSGAEVANPIYREVLARELAYNAQENLQLPRAAWLRADGSLDAAVLVDTFLAWWRENSDFAERNAPEGYQEALVHLAFMAFLQRVVNGGGQVAREFAAGRGRVDLCVEMGGQRAVFELKRVRPDRGSLERSVREGVEQLCGYLDTLGEREGWLIVFDQRPGLSWDQRMWKEDREVGGRLLHLRGA